MYVYYICLSPHGSTFQATNEILVFLISDFRRDLNIVYFLLGIYEILVHRLPSLSRGIVCEHQLVPSSLDTWFPTCGLR